MRIHGTAKQFLLLALGLFAVLIWIPFATPLLGSAGDGGVFFARDGSRAATGAFDLASNRIKNVGSPLVGTDAINQGDADTRYLNVAGDSATGLVVLPTVDINGGTVDGITSLSSDGSVIISNTGSAVIGHTSASVTGAASLSPRVQFTGATGDDASLLLNFDANNSVAPTLVFAKSRDAAQMGSTPVIVNNNDKLGTIAFTAADGVNRSTISAQIRVLVDDASPAANSIAGEMIFSTAKGVGSDDLTAVLTLRPDGDATFAGSVGTSANRVSKLWTVDQDTTNAEVVSSSAKYKKNVVPLAPADLSAVDIINLITVATYEHDLDLDPSDRHKLGIIAESLEAAYPTAAPTKLYPEDFVDENVIDYDDDGLVTGSHTERKPTAWVEGPGVDTGALSALLVSGIQTLSQQLAGVGSALPVCDKGTRGKQFVVLSDDLGDAVFICLKNVPGVYGWKGL